jgi:hypothetical protein
MSIYFKAIKRTESDDDFDVYCAENYDGRLETITRTLRNLENLKNKEMLKALSLNQLTVILNTVELAISEKELDLQGKKIVVKEK